MAKERDPARGQRIRELRKQHGDRPQRAVAMALGVNPRAYQEWEYGGEIAWPNAQALAAYFNESVDYILDGIRQNDGADPIELLERRLGRLEASVGALASLPAALRELRTGLDDHHGWVRDHLQELALALEELQTAAALPSSPEADAPTSEEKPASARRGRSPRTPDQGA